LHTLYLAVDAVNIDIDPEAEQFQRTSLKSLYLLFSPIEDAKVVARVVSLMFPFVDEVVANTEVIPTWIAVNDYLRSSKTSALQNCRITGIDQKSRALVLNDVKLEF